MVFLFIITISIILLVTLFLFSKIKIEIRNLKYSSNLSEQYIKNIDININKNENGNDNKHKKINIDGNYIIVLKLCILGKIPVINIKITSEKIKKFKFKFKEKIKKIDIQKIEKDMSINKLKEVLKENKFVINRINLNIEIGTENASLTAILIPIISMVISFLLKNKIKSYKIQKFNVKPVFINKNLLNIDFSGIFEIKMIHIINIIYILNKKEGVKKYERTSNRRSYAYSYE